MKKWIEGAPTDTGYYWFVLRGRWTNHPYIQGGYWSGGDYNRVLLCGDDEAEGVLFHMPMDMPEMPSELEGQLAC